MSASAPTALRRDRFFDIVRDDRQNDAARTLLTLLEDEATTHRLTAAQVREVELAMEEADRGELATDAQMKKLWEAFGL